MNKRQTADVELAFHHVPDEVPAKLAIFPSLRQPERFSHRRSGGNMPRLRRLSNASACGSLGLEAEAVDLELRA